MHLKNLVELVLVECVTNGTTLSSFFCTGPSSIRQANIQETVEVEHVQDFQFWYVAL